MGGHQGPGLLPGQGRHPRGDAVYRNRVLDVSVHKQAEALMRRNMEHQEVLTREVSHRVKNSLALVAGLLGLQARAASDPRVKQAIADAEMRIGTVARLHDHL